MRKTLARVLRNFITVEIFGKCVKRFCACAKMS